MKTTPPEKYKTKLHKIRHKIVKLNKQIVKYDLRYQLTLEPISTIPFTEEINPKTGARHKKWYYE